MSNPVVGDMVWYRPGSEDALKSSGDWPLAAIVVAVFDEGNVNLTVFASDGVQWSRVDVWPRQSDEQTQGFFEERSKEEKVAAKQEQADESPPKKKRK